MERLPMLQTIMIHDCRNRIVRGLQICKLRHGSLCADKCPFEKAMEDSQQSCSKRLDEKTEGRGAMFSSRLPV